MFSILEIFDKLSIFSVNGDDEQCDMSEFSSSPSSISSSHSLLLDSLCPSDPSPPVVIHPSIHLSNRLSLIHTLSRLFSVCALLLSHAISPLISALSLDPEGNTSRAPSHLVNQVNFEILPPTFSLYFFLQCVWNFTDGVLFSQTAHIMNSQLLSA